jgi:ABC-type Fe3+/spermidine/putrescine transport system ATPase subunit
MSPPILELREVTKRFGPTIVADRFSLTVARGEFFTFLGPSGSGKSSLLRMVAGLERPDSGTIIIDGREVTNVPAWERNLGMMFQSYAIFPHMTAAQNVGYGVKVRGLSGPQVEARTKEMLALVGLSGLAGRNATLLSGGEQQRVALARALAPEPRMLLLDEPLSALDEKIRRAMQAELKRIHVMTGTTFLYVTHDQEEALTMSDRIAVISAGRSVEIGEPERLFRRPRTRFVASFFRGSNILDARPGADGRLVIGGVEVSGINLPIPAGGVVHLAVRAENVHLTQPYPKDAFAIPGEITDAAFRGTVVDYALVLQDGQTLTATSTRHLAPGKRVEIRIDPGDLILLEDQEPRRRSVK